jgi:hypothetical protein
MKPTAVIIQIIIFVYGKKFIHYIHYIPYKFIFYHFGNLIG